MEDLSADNVLAHLLDPKIRIDIARCRYFLARVLHLSTTKSADLTTFLPPVVNLMAHSDLLIKKTAFRILTKISDFKSDFLLLAVNTLLKDSQDSNPTVRALAIQTLCCVQHEALTEHRVKCILAGIKDNSAYVRRAAVMACVSVSKSDLDGLKDSGIVNLLYELIRDPDPIVLVNCLLALEEILKSEGGVVLNKKMVNYIVKHLDVLTTWGLGYVMKLLLKYKPKAEEEIVDLMNVLDPLLENNSPTVSIHTLQVFLHLIETMPQLEGQVFQRCKNTILSIFTAGNTELIGCVIQYLQPHSHNVHTLLSSHYKTVFCRLKDPVYLKVHKLTLLTGLADSENFTDILDEIILHCSDRETDVSLCAIQCLKRLSDNWPDLAETLLRAFTKLLKSDKDHVISNTLQVLVTMPVQNMKKLPAVSEQLCAIARDIHDSLGMIAVLYLIGQLDTDTSHATASLSVMEHFIELYPDLDTKAKGQLLLTGMQLLCQRPAEFQVIIGELMDLCCHNTDQDLVQQATFYYSILHDNLDAARQIFTGI